MLRTRPPSRCPGSSIRSEAPEKELLRLPRKTRKQDHRKMEATATLHGPWRVYMNSSYNGTTKRPPYHPPHILISLLPCYQHETSKLPAVPPIPPVLSGRKQYTRHSANVTPLSSLSCHGLLQPSASNPRSLAFFDCHKQSGRLGSEGEPSPGRPWPARHLPLQPA